MCCLVQSLHCRKPSSCSARFQWWLGIVCMQDAANAATQLAMMKQSQMIQIQSWCLFSMLEPHWELRQCLTNKGMGFSSRLDACPLFGKVLRNIHSYQCTGIQCSPAQSHSCCVQNVYGINREGLGGTCMAVHSQF